VARCEDEWSRDARGQKHKNRFDGRLLALFAMTHAFLVLVTMKAELLSSRQWLVFAWLWAIWPFILILHPTRSLLRTSVALGAGVLLLLPCVPQLFAYTAWFFRGFAP
jgi:hypothetical protein